MSNSEVSNSGIEYGGEINEEGYLNGFDRRGFTPEKCALELVANSIDSLDRRNREASNSANTNKVVFDNKGDVILFVDNGYGMDMPGAKNMFSLHKQNHTNDKSRGVSGIGAKPSLSILSEKTTVKIYTRQLNGAYICVTVPWDKIHEGHVYTGQVEFCQMTEVEIQQFKTERDLHEMLYNNDYCGTTISFLYNETLAEVLEENFKSIKDSSMTDLMNRIGIVFGRDDVEFLYKHHEVPVYQKLEKYNYFNFPKPSFYKGYDEYVIENWYNSHTKKDRFICTIDGVEYEVKQMGKKCATKAEPSTTNKQGFQHVGDYTMLVGLLNEKEVFDTTLSDPKSKMVNGIEHIGQYNKIHIGTESKDYLKFLNGTKFVRNNQFIGLIPTEKGFETRRGGADSHYEQILLQSEIRYNPISNQNNHLDHIGQIQENKNQFDGLSVPLHFRRLIDHLRKMKWNQISAYFNSFKAQPRPAPIEDSNDRDSVISHVSSTNSPTSSVPSPKKKLVVTSPSNPTTESTTVTTPAASVGITPHALEIIDREISPSVTSPVRLPPLSTTNHTQPQSHKATLNYIKVFLTINKVSDLDAMIAEASDTTTPGLAEMCRSIKAVQTYLDSKKSK
jgi:hypothetical protein